MSEEFENNEINDSEEYQNEDNSEQNIENLSIQTNPNEKTISGLFKEWFLDYADRKSVV